MKACLYAYVSLESVHVVYEVVAVVSTQDDVSENENEDMTDNENEKNDADPSVSLARSPLLGYISVLNVGGKSKIGRPPPLQRQPQ